MELDVNFWTFIAGPFVSLLVGLLAKSHATAGLKSILNLGLSAAAGVILEHTTGGIDPDRWQDYLLAFLTTWITSLSIYHGFWKPTQVAPAINNATRNFGFGSPPDLEVDNPSAEDQAEFSESSKSEHKDDYLP